MNKSVKTEPQPSEDYKALQKQFESICDKMEQLYKPTFEKVFEALYKIDSNLNKNYPCTNNESDIKEAVLQAEFGSDEALCKDFIEYNRLFIEGKKIQMQGLELRAHDFAKVSQQQQEQPEGWQFYPISIIASSELHDIIKDIIKSDAENGKGLFANVTDIPLEDVDEDEFDMVEGYNCQATFTKYFAELKQYGVIGTAETEAFLCKDFKTLLMALLKHLAAYIKAHTDQQAATKNKIADTIKELDKLPLWGLFLQILTLQGLCRWLESVNIDEGDCGFDEAQSLYGWLNKQLVDKKISFTYRFNGNENKQRLKPLCNYLYSTNIGRMVQDAVFNKKPQQPESNIDTKQDTDELIYNLKCFDFFDSLLWKSNDFNDYKNFICNPTLPQTTNDMGFIEKYIFIHTKGYKTILLNSLFEEALKALRNYFENFVNGGDCWHTYDFLNTDECNKHIKDDVCDTNCQYFQECCGIIEKSDFFIFAIKQMIRHSDIELLSRIEIKMEEFPYEKRLLERSLVDAKFEFTKVDIFSKEKKPETNISKPETQPENIVLPDELNTDKGKELLQKVIDGGFCDEAYRWNKPKALLAYFADKASEFLKIGKGQTIDGNIKISWKPFETLFCIKDKSGKWAKVKGLSGARNDYKKTGQLPYDSKDIDCLF